MATLMRWDPFRELATMRDMMDRMVDDSFFESPRLLSRQLAESSLALDVVEDEDAYTVKASIPGIDPNDVEVTLTDNVLTIRGETKEEKDVEEKNYRLRERRFGSFSRSLNLPVAVDADKVEATHENGVLTLSLPKSEAVKPKRISVKKMIEANK
jgi:HSP20 family protein